MRGKLDADAIITALEPRALHYVDLFDNACPNLASAATVSSRGCQFSVDGYGKHDQYKGQVLFLVSRKNLSEYLRRFRIEFPDAGDYEKAEID